MGQIGGFGMQITTHSADETQALGQRLAKRLLPGDVLAYFGDLGAGKTALTRGIAQGLGVTDLVTSPTYTIVNEYLTGRIPLFHFDMYRLGSSDELFDIGWEDYLARGGVCAVEWSENVEDVLRDAIHITIEKDPLEPDTRRINIEGGSRIEAAGIRILCEGSRYGAAVRRLPACGIYAEFRPDPQQNADGAGKKYALRL